VCAGVLWAAVLIYCGLNGQNELQGGWCCATEATSERKADLAPGYCLGSDRSSRDPFERKTVWLAVVLPVRQTANPSARQDR
jgi:hypothetical protein